MKKYNWFQQAILWLAEKYYNCEKGRHKWGYLLSDVGCIYLDDSKVPKEHWKCMNCGKRQFPEA